MHGDGRNVASGIHARKGLGNSGGQVVNGRRCVDLMPGDKQKRVDNNAFENGLRLECRVR